MISFICVTINLILFSSLATSENIESGGEIDEVVCNTPQGKLLGSVLKSRGGRNFYSFRGIPFAEKPDRFQVCE